MFYRTLCLCLLMLPSSAMAATWIEVGGSDEVIAYVDTDSIRRNGSEVKSWLKWAWKENQDLTGFYGKFYRLHKQLQVSNCAEGTFASAQGTFYTDADGADPIHSYTVAKNDLSFVEPVPESNGEIIVKYVCAHASKKNK